MPERVISGAIQSLSVKYHDDEAGHARNERNHWPRRALRRRFGGASEWQGATQGHGGGGAGGPRKWPGIGIWDAPDRRADDVQCYV